MSHHEGELVVFRYFQDWWHRRNALQQLASMQQQEEATLTLSDAHPFAWALNAAKLGDREEGLRQWHDACQKYPDFVRNSPDSLKLLLDLGLYDEAESFAWEARKRSPRDPVRAGGPAKVAEARGDFAEAAARWANMRRKFPQQPQPYAGEAWCLSRLAKLDEADTLITKALARFPTELSCGMEAGRIADCRKDWPAALARWENVYRINRHPAGEIGAARALREMGRLDEAEQRLLLASATFPLAVELFMELAHIAYKRGDASEAARRWQKVRTKFPMLPFGYREEYRVLREMNDIDGAEQVALAAIDRFPNASWAREMSQDSAGAAS